MTWVTKIDNLTLFNIWTNHKDHKLNVINQIKQIVLREFDSNTKVVIPTYNHESKLLENKDYIHPEAGTVLKYVIHFERNTAKNLLEHFVNVNLLTYSANAENELLLDDDKYDKLKEYLDLPDGSDSIEQFYKIDVTKYLEFIIGNMLLPMYGNADIGSNWVGNDDTPYQSAYNLITEPKTDCNGNLLVVKSGTGTGKSVVLTSILIDHMDHITSGNVAIKHGDTRRVKLSHKTSGNFDVKIKTHSLVNAKKTLVLQPRQINVKSNAGFVANLYGGKLGGLVGLKYRGEDTSRTPGQQLTFMTQESFLVQLNAAFRKIQNGDPKPIQKIFSKYKLIILDEAHEPSIVNELLVYYFKYFGRNASDTKFMILSATIQPYKYINYFNETAITSSDEPSQKCVLIVSVKSTADRFEYYLDSPADDYCDAAVSRTKQIVENTTDPANSCDIIIFVPGEAEIKNLRKRLLEIINSTSASPAWSGVLLQDIKRNQTSHDENIAKLDYSDTKMIPNSELGNKTTRRIYLGTNKAETGITLPNLRYVIDTGMKNISFYNPDFDGTMLIKSGASKNNTGQRWGRVGRKVGSEGHVYCLYTEELYKALPEDDHSGLLTDDYSTYFPTMIGLCNFVHGTPDIMHMDLMTPNLSHKTIMNHLIRYKRYGAIDQSTQNLTPIGNDYFAVSRYKTYQTAWLLAGSGKYSCSYEMAIAIACQELGEILADAMPSMVKAYQHMFKNSSVVLHGTILPKIYFMKETLCYNPGYPVWLEYTIRDATEIDNVTYNRISFDNFDNKLRLAGIKNCRTRKAIMYDFRNIFLEILEFMKNNSIAIKSSDERSDVKECILHGLGDNIAYQVTSSLPFYKHKNNPSIISEIPDADPADLKSLQKIKYTEAFMVSDVFQISDYEPF